MSARVVSQYVILIIILSFSQILCAQEYDNSPLHFTTHDGLANNRTKAIFQDTSGFMWFGTDDGLSRYDGYQYKNYSFTPFDSCSFRGNIVTTIAEDLQGKLWIGVFDGGVYSFDPVTECFEHLHIENLTQPKDGEVYKIHIDPQGIVWVITEHLIFKRYDPKTHKIESFGEKQKFRYIFDLQEDQSGRYLFLNIWGKDIEVFDKQELTFIRHIHAALFKRPKKYNAQSIIKDHQGKLWIYRSNNKELQQVDLTTGKTETFSDSNWQTKIRDTHQLSPFRNLIFQDHEGLIWKSNPYGLSAFAPKQKKFSKQYAILGKQKKPIYRINAVLVAKSGIVWIATETGIYMINPQIDQLQKYVFSGLVETVYEDPKGRVWVGGHWGLKVFSPDSLPSLDLPQYFTKFITSSTSCRPLKILNDPQNRDHFIWISISRLGLLKFDIQNRKFTLYTPKDTNNHLIDIYDILPEGMDTFWLACNNGLQKFNIHDHTFRWYKHHPDDSQSIPAGIIETVYKDRQGLLWVGTESNGMASFDQTSEKFTRFTHDPNQKNSLSNNSIHDFHEDQKDNFWVATSGGLNLFDRKKETFRHYTIKDGLPKNNILSILEDKTSKLWLGTQQGISKFDSANEIFTNYDQRDGIFNTELFPRSSYKNKQGKLFFGGAGGVTSFYPKQLSQNKYLPPLVITKFKKFNKEIPLHQVVSPEGILELSYEDTMISFEVAALNYYNSYKNQYAYKLEGLHEDWIYLGNQRNITLTNLSGKKYNLRIKASNGQGEWHEGGIVIPIRVTPPFWTTNWFQASMGTSVLIILLTAYLIHIRFIQLQKRRLASLVDKKTLELKTVNKTKDRFFAIIAHDLRGPLTSFQEISYLINYFLDNNRPDKIKLLVDKIDQSATGLHSLLNNLLNWAMVQQKTISHHPEKINLKLLINECLSKYQASLGIHQIDMCVTVLEDVSVWVDYNSTMSIIRNLVSNAIKYTPNGGRIELKVTSSMHETVLEVKDNGLGIDTNTLEQLFDIGHKTSHYGVRKEEGSGLGLILCKEFAKLNNATIHVESILHKGSTFRIVFYKKTQQ